MLSAHPWTAFAVWKAHAAAALPLYVFNKQAKLVLDDVLERLPEMPNLDEIRARAEEPSPYTMVALQARTLPAPLSTDVAADLPGQANSSYYTILLDLMSGEVTMEQCACGSGVYQGSLCMVEGACRERQ